MYTLGVDIGGTFTDFTVYNRLTSEVHVEKCLTTPDAPEKAVLAGLKLLASRLPDFAATTERISHATTLVTNAILERKGPPTALITTEGFRDVLETRTEYRYNVYDLFIRFPVPIVPRQHRYGVPERIYSDGTVRLPLNEERLKSIAAEIRSAGIAAVAVCFLHAYRNSEHEKRAVKILARELPGVALSVSHEVNPEPREYERTSTTVLDAYVKPIVDRYLSSLAQQVLVRGFKPEVEIMLSNGGSTTSEIARRFPIQMIESGPAAGVEAAIWMCRRLGIEDALSFDMGGTTAKMCIIRNCSAERSRNFEAGRIHRFIAGSGFPVAVPVYDLVEIGAGGGSLARIDSLGLVSVGPESAGADPGPACYARGGIHPTVTDADLVLGLLDPEYFLGGDMKLDIAAAGAAIGRTIGQPLGLDTPEAAFGVFDIVNETMASAARLHIAEKGCDAGKLTIMAFGGAGPLHAIELARKLGCPRVVIPPNAGIMSSFGLVTAPPAFERMVSVKHLLRDCAPGYLRDLINDLRQQVADVLGGAKDVSFRQIVEMLHHGQEYPLEVPFEENEVGDGLQDLLHARFDRRYRELYGRSDDETPVEVSALRVIGSRPAATVERILAPVDSAHPPVRRRVYQSKSKGYVEISVTSRSALPAGIAVEGPIAIQDRESGIVIRSGDRATLHESGAVFVELA
jgi:N-methylhydantoinase A